MSRKFIAAGVVLAAGAAAALAQTEGETDFYRIEVGDRIAVSVLEDPGMNQTALVRPDGRITLPLVGTVPAQGRTIEALQSTIRRALTPNFVQPPTVTVSLVDLGDGPVPPAFYILGEVARPGRYELETPVDILQALALAGGPGVFAATERIQLRRRAEGEEVVTLFDYEQVKDGGAVTESLGVVDGDVIVVPVRGLFE
jgi:polysaccharide export outer membrane protein